MARPIASLFLLTSRCRIERARTISRRSSDVALRALRLGHGELYPVASILLCPIERFIGAFKRRQDLDIRWLWLTDTNADRDLEAISELDFPDKDDRFQITVRIGISEPEPTDMEILPALERADEALYRAKQNGRHRIELSMTKSECPQRNVA